MAYDGWPGLPPGLDPEDFETVSAHAEFLFPTDATPEAIGRAYEAIMGALPPGMRLEWDDGTAVPWNPDAPPAPWPMVAAVMLADNRVTDHTHDGDVLARIDDALDGWEAEAGHWRPVDDPEAHADAWLADELANVRPEETP